MPAEHGAWGILLVPLVTSAALAHPAGAPWTAAGLVVTCTLSLFILRGSVEAHGTWRALLSPAHLALLAVSAATGLALILLPGRTLLLALALTALLLFLLHGWLLRRHHARNTGVPPVLRPLHPSGLQPAVEKRSLAAELLGVALLSLGAPAAWIAERGALDAHGAQVWLLNLLFFTGGVLYVKYRVRGVLAHRPFERWQERCAFAWPVCAYHLLLALFLASWMWWQAQPVALLLAFVPGIFRAHALLLQLGQRFPIKRLGWTEVAHALFFAAAQIAGLRT
jgi:hypothetical protein